MLLTRNNDAAQTLEYSVTAEMLDRAFGKRV